MHMYVCRMPLLAPSTESTSDLMWAKHHQARGAVEKWRAGGCGGVPDEPQVYLVGVGVSGGGGSQGQDLGPRYVAKEGGNAVGGRELGGHGFLNDIP